MITTAPTCSPLRSRKLRIVVLAILAAVIAPLLMTAFASSAHADDEDPDNYSLYQLASNASTYFGEKNSPDGDHNFDEFGWVEITDNPATGGDMLGYADPEFSLFNVIGWLFAEASGSTQTITFDTLKASNSAEDFKFYSGMLDYAHFGAANRDLGIDAMSSGVGGQITSMFGGLAMWAMYALALASSTAFFLVVQLLKMLNPFMWFGEGVKAVNATFGEGMVAGGDSTVVDGPLSGLVGWISDWYQLINSIAWEALVPLFIGFTILALVMFKKMDRGSLIKKLLVRMVFIGVGLPLIGSMYTGVLDRFDDSMLGQHAGPTRVVLSTYVDFESWMNRDRLAVPDEALIAWDGDQASPESMMSVRTTALAINKHSHPEFSGIEIGTKAQDPGTAWRNGAVITDESADDDVKAVFSTVGILNRYIASSIASASDFESGIKSSITRLDVPDSEKRAWFVDKDSYGDVERFGEEKGPAPTEHPVLATQEGAGLTSSNPGADRTTFTTEGVVNDCGMRVMDADGNLAACNLSALSAYNYLNTGFDSTSMTMFSSNKVMSGLSREDHMAVSQVGTGPAKFMYWSNAATVLGCIAVLGLWYAFGMLAGSVKRTFSLVAAIPFATLGAVAAIAKVVVYSLALILEVIVTLFLYQFVSEFLISIPGIMAGPVSSLMAEDGLFGSAVLGGIVVVLLTLLSTILVLAVTIALLRVRKVVLQAMDEVFTKLVDKFLETSPAPKPGRSSSMMPALASGIGAGAGMAMGSRLGSRLEAKPGSTKSPKPTGQPTSKTASTNAGGLNPDAKALEGKGPLALEAGDRPSGGPDGSDVPTTGDSGGRGPAGLDGGKGSDGKGQGSGAKDKGGPLRLAKGKASESKSDKATAQGVSARGGLSKLGYESGALGDKATKPGSGSSIKGGKGSEQPGSTRSDASSRSTGGGRAGSRKELTGPSKGTQFGTGGGESGKGTSIRGEAVGGVNGQTDRRVQRGDQAQVPQRPSSQAPVQSARFTAGTRGAAELNPGRADSATTAGARAASRGSASDAPPRRGRTVPQAQVPTTGSADRAQPLVGGAPLQRQSSSALAQGGRRASQGLAPASSAGGDRWMGVPQAAPRPAPVQQRPARQLSAPRAEQPAQQKPSGAPARPTTRPAPTLPRRAAEPTVPPPSINQTSNDEKKEK